MLSQLIRTCDFVCRPQKLDVGRPHPDHIVESASLAAVSAPNIWYDVTSLRVRLYLASRPQKFTLLRFWDLQIGVRHCVCDDHALMQADWESGAISNAQLETVVYALQRFFGEKLPDGARAGFFLGDGAGVGKGRQISAVVKEMWRKGTRRILWLSHCNDLREDARRDMVDMNINVPSCSRKPACRERNCPKIDVWPKGNITPPTATRIADEFSKGVYFATYALLSAGTRGVCKKVQGNKQRNNECALQLVFVFCYNVLWPRVSCFLMRTAVPCIGWAF
jgi:hypothetical protein